MGGAELGKEIGTHLIDGGTGEDAAMKRIHHFLERKQFIGV